MHRMARDCGLEISNEDLQLDWEDTVAAIDNESEYLESVTPILHWRATLSDPRMGVGARRLSPDHSRFHGRPDER